MKKILKTAFLFLILLCLFFTNVYGNMTIEAMEKSKEFYNSHKILFDSMQIIAMIMKLALLVFIVIIPIIIIYKKIKLKKDLKEKNKHIIKILALAELLFIFNIYIIKIAEMAKQGSEMSTYINIFIILISILNIGIISFKLLKKKS